MDLDFEVQFRAGELLSAICRDQKIYTTGESLEQLCKNICHAVKICLGETTALDPSRVNLIFSRV